MADDLLDGFEPDNAAPIAVAGASGNADNAGKALTLSKKSGVPAQVIDADLEGFVNQYKSKQAGEAVKANPQIAGYMQGQALHAKVSNDDYDNLNEITKAINSYNQAGLLQNIPKAFEALKSPEGRDKMLTNLKSWPSEFVKGLIQPLLTPGEMGAGKVDIESGEGIDQAINLAAFIGLGRLSKLPKTGKTSGMAPLTPRAEDAIAEGKIPPAGVDPAIDDLHIEQQKVDAAKVDQLVQVTDASRTKERAPPALAEFVRQHDTGDVGISAEAISKIYESEGKTPAAGDGLFGFVPDIGDQLASGLASGVDVKVPLADYVANVDSALHAKVKDSIRFREEGVTKEEATTLGEVEEPKLKEGEKIVGQEGDQFTTSEGRTIDRAEALKVAMASGQFAEDRSRWAMIKAGYDPQILHDDNVSYSAREYMTKVAEAEDSLYLEPLFKSGKDLNITEGEFKRYSDKIERRQNELLDRSIEAARREVAKRQTAEWRKAEAELTNQVSTDYRSRPDIVADRYLRSGDLPTGERVEPLKLDRATVEEMLGKEHSIAELTQEKGANPDDIASVLGFDSGAEMVKALDEYNKGRKAQGLGPKAYFDQAVAKEVDLQMREKFGLLPENIAAEAREIALGEYHADILADEVKILAGQAGGEPPLSRAEMRQWVADNFNAQKLSQVRDWEPLRRAVEKGGRDAEKALLGGDFEGAFKAKQRQLLAFLGAREADTFRRDQARAEKLIDRIGASDAPKSLDPAFVYQTRRMLGRLGIDAGPVAGELKEFNQFIADTEGQAAVADFLLDPDWKKTIKDMTVEEFRDLGKSLQSLVHNAREAKKMDSVRGKADLDNVVFDIKKELDRFDLIEKPLNPTPMERLRSVGRYTVGMHLLVERVLDYTDKYNPNGPLTTYLDRPLRAAYNKELTLSEMVTKHLAGLKEFVNESLADKIDNKLIPNPLSKSGYMDMTRANLRQLMLNLGSRSGVEKVTKGFGIDEMSLRKFVHDHASEADTKWVQGMFDLFAKLKPEADAMQLRDTGVPVDSVELSELGTKYGKVKGYFPLMYDQARSNIQGDIRAQNPTFDEHYIAATTPQGYTRRRTGYSAAIDLEGLYTGSKIQGMVHDIAFREAVRNASKLINNADFMLEMRKKWGTEVADLLPGWLKDIANVHNVDDNYARGLVRGLAFFRQNVVSSLIALNPGTFIKHGVTAASMSVQRVGSKELVGAIKDMVSAGKELAQQNPKLDPEFISALKDVTDNTERGESTRQFILDSSPLMRNRQRTYADSISGATESAMRPNKFMEVRDKAMRFGRFPVAMSDAISAFPTWLAAYKKEFALNGDHAQSVFVADKEVSRAHGSSFIGDKPAIMRQKNNLGGEALRWATPLYNFWNHMANNYFQAAWDIASMARGKPEPNATGRDLANRAFWLFVIPLAVEELASPALDEHKESLGVRSLKALARHVGGSFVGLRDVTNAIAGGYEPSVGLIGTVGKSLANIGRDINRIGAGRTVRKDWMTDLTTGAGFATGIGGPQYGKTLGFITDLITGKETPKTFNEYRQGLRTGHSKARAF